MRLFLLVSLVAVISIAGWTLLGVIVFRGLWMWYGLLNGPLWRASRVTAHQNVFGVILLSPYVSGLSYCLFLSSDLVKGPGASQ